MSDDIELPPLPPEVDSVWCMIRGERDLSEPMDRYYTADQMRAYARAAVLADRAAREGESALLDHLRAAPGREPAGLPTLPTPYTAQIMCGENTSLYTAEQMLAYAAAVAACHRMPEDDEMTHEVRDDSDRLKPCPFCGGDAEAGEVDGNMEDSNFGGRFISCLRCGASTNLRFACGDDPTPLLIEQWNRRAVPAEARGAQGADLQSFLAWMRVNRPDANLSHTGKGFRHEPAASMWEQWEGPPDAQADERAPVTPLHRWPPGDGESAAPPVAQEADEQAAFDAWWRRPDRHIVINRTDAWCGWDARASLSAAPVASQVRAEALEEAARICESVNNSDNPMTAKDCADAILALKDQP